MMISKTEAERLISRLRRIRNDPMTGRMDQKALEKAITVIREAAKIPLARVLTAAEVIRSDAGTVLWEECLDGFDHTSRIYPVMVDEEGRIGDFECWIHLSRAEAAMVPDEDGCCLRWWSARPSEEEMEATLWPNK